MAVASGQRTTESQAAVQRFIDVRNEILLLEPSATPLTVLTNKIGNTVNAKDPEYKWVEDHLFTRFDAVNNGAGYDDNDTSIVVDTGTVFFAGALVNVPRTGEIIRVTSVSTNTLTVARGYSGSTAAALVDDDPLFVVGAAYEEGVTSPAARHENPTPVTNYTQIFRHTIELTGTAMRSSNLTSPHDWVHQNKKTMIEHKKAIELTGLHGKPVETTGPGGNPLRTTGGALHYLTSNRQDAGGALTEAEVETWIRSLMRYGSDKRLVLASPLVISVLNNHSLGKIQTRVGDKVYGVQVMEWVSAHGTLSLVKHNLLEGAIWGGYAIALDMNADVAQRPLNGSGAPHESGATHVRTNVQANDADARKDEVLTEAGWQFPQPERHGVLTGVTG